MAPKRPTPTEEPPEASSTEEEETSSEEEEESSGEEEEEPPTQPPPKPSSPPSQKSQPRKLESATPQPQSLESDSGSDSGSDSDSDSERPVNVPDPDVKPIASKPMEEAAPKTKKPRSKPSATAAKSTAQKRGNESERDPPRDTTSKRAKMKEPESDGVAADKTGEDTKKQLFQRLWSEDDEIAVLKGMIDYSTKKGADPSADMNAFHEFIKKSLHVDVTRAQLMDKIRRLKKKYKNNLGKGKKGEERTFSKPHEQKAYELSKKIWGGEATKGGSESTVKSNGKAVKNQKGSRSLASLKAELLSSPDGTKGQEKMDIDGEKSLGASGSGSEIVKFDKDLGLSGLEEFVVKHGLDMVKEPKRAELEEKWKQLQVAELELFVRRTELIREQASLMLEAYKSS